MNQEGPWTVSVVQQHPSEARQVGKGALLAAGFQGEFGIVLCANVYLCWGVLGVYEGSD